MADLGAHDTRPDVAVTDDATPAIVCATCNGATPLVSLRPEVEVPRCRHCGVRLPGFGTVEAPTTDRSTTVTALVDALDSGDLDAAGALLRSDVVWQEAPSGLTVSGRDALVEHWRSVPVSRALGTLTVADDVVFGLVLERDLAGDGDNRLVRWFVGFHGELIASCWVWQLRREAETAASARA